MSDYQIECEYTDTFGGQPNYCWRRHAVIDVPSGTPKRKIYRLIRNALDIQGVAGKWDDLGDEWHFRPYRMCRIVMARVLY